MTAANQRPPKHTQHLEGIEDFERALRKVTGLEEAHITRSYSTNERVSRSGQRASIDLRENALLINCGNSEGWQELFVPLPENVVLPRLIAETCLVFHEEGIGIDPANLQIVKTGAVPQKELEEWLAKLRREWEEEEAARRREEKEEEEQKIAALRRLIPKTGRKVFEMPTMGEGVAETPAAAIVATATPPSPELQSIPRGDWPVVYHLLLDHAKTHGATEEDGWKLERATSVLRDHPDTRMKKENAALFLREATKRGLVKRISRQRWVILEGEWVVPEKEETVPTPPEPEKEEREVKEAPVEHSLLKRVLALIHKGENPIPFITEAIPLTAEPPRGKRQEVEEEANELRKEQAEEIRRAELMIIEHLSYVLRMRGLLQAGQEEPSDEDFAAGAPSRLQ